MTLRLTSCLAANFDGPLHAIAAQWGGEARFEDTLSWQAREQLVDDRQVDVAWTCGLLFVLKDQMLKDQMLKDQMLKDQMLEDQMLKDRVLEDRVLEDRVSKDQVSKDRVRPGVWQPIAAPVMRGAHYRDKPIYFSDVVVRAECGCREVADLHGMRFVYNDRQSLSGYYALRDMQARQPGFRPGRQIASGGHERSLSYLLANRADFALIDSTVLEAWSRVRGRNDRARLRSLGRVGPYPSPPLLVRAGLDPDVKAALRRRVLTLHHDTLHHNADQSAELNAAAIKRFAPVDASYYAELRAKRPPDLT